jgi:hypothetical protein
MNLSGIFSAVGAGKMLAAFNPAVFLGSIALTVATTAAQRGAQELGRNSGRGFWSDMFQTSLSTFSFKLSDLATNFVQKALGGADSSKRT